SDHPSRAGIVGGGEYAGGVSGRDPRIQRQGSESIGCGRGESGSAAPCLAARLRTTLLYLPRGLRKLHTALTDEGRKGIYHSQLSPVRSRGGAALMLPNRVSGRTDRSRLRGPRVVRRFPHHLLYRQGAGIILRA